MLAPHARCARCQGQMVLDRDHYERITSGWSHEEAGLTLSCLSCGRVVYVERQGRTVRKARLTTTYLPGAANIRYNGGKPVDKRRRAVA